MIADVSTAVSMPLDVAGLTSLGSKVSEARSAGKPWAKALQANYDTELTAFNARRDERVALHKIASNWVSILKGGGGEIKGISNAPASLPRDLDSLVPYLHSNNQSVLWEEYTLQSNSSLPCPPFTSGNAALALALTQESERSETFKRALETTLCRLTH